MVTPNREHTESYHLVFNYSTKSKISCPFLTMADCSRSLETHVTCDHLCLSNATGLITFSRTQLLLPQRCLEAWKKINSRINNKNNYKFMVSTKKRKKYFHELDNTLVIKQCNPIIRYHREP